MRLLDAAVHSIAIPFVRTVTHSSASREQSDSVIVRLRDEEGVEGYGEGAGRSYVTGETSQGMMRHIAGHLWPAIAGREVPDLDPALQTIESFMPDAAESDGVVAYNASRSAVELALVDLWLRRRGLSAKTLLAPKRPRIVYSGIIAVRGLEESAQRAQLLKAKGLRHFKLKVGMGDDFERVKLIREVLGEGASLRLDANGGWRPDEAATILGRIERFNIAAVEQPLSRGPVQALALLRRRCSIPVMVDESLVTLRDARDLIAADAVDYFNIRVSKCGGVGRSLAIARLALEAGVRLQVGAQVGETGLLAMAGRLLAAAVDQVEFVEGSAGVGLLREDLVSDDVRWGASGVGELPSGPGWGVEVVPERLSRYSTASLEMGLREGRA